MAEDFGAAEHRGVEFIRALHVLHGKAEMLNALEPGAERTGRSRVATALLLASERGAVTGRRGIPPIATPRGGSRTARAIRVFQSGLACYLLV